MTKAKYPEGFLTRVGEWVNKTQPVQRPRYGDKRLTFKVFDVDEHGTDWAGDTFEGFRSEFYVNIQTDHGSIHVEGEELASLWRYVMRGGGE